MKTTQSSITAEGIAMIRAAESSRPANLRICEDPYAIRFIRPVFKTFLQPLMWYGRMRSPGVAEFLIARTCFFDDAVSQAIQDGVQQLVILGAGFDSRAYRFEGLKAGVSVFEVDHPATQAVKVQKIKEIFGKLPAHVRYVPIDFERESLLLCLEASQYKEHLKTLFLWEGVTYYLASVAVDTTLAFIALHSGLGSSVVFDYMDAAALSAARKRAEVASMHRYRGMTGEELQFGIERGSINSFLLARGFNRVEDHPAEELKQKYFSGPDAGRPIAPIYSIAQGWVPA